MDINSFVANFAEQFEDTDVNVIKADTKFHEIDEWSSLVAMGVIAMVKIRYGKSLSGTDLRACVTVEDVYNLIMKK